MKERNPSHPSRIMIFGIPGGGKSTFAVELGRQLHLSVFHLDKYFFTKNWQERNYDEFLHIQKKIIAKDEWIIDGNATRSLEMRFSRADVILYFRFNRLLCLWRIFKRLIFKNHSISDRAEGCSENVRFQLIRYLWGFDKRVRQNINKFRALSPQAIFFELRNKKDLQLAMDYLLNLKGENAVGMWADRNDLPDLQTLRTEFDR